MKVCDLYVTFVSRNVLSPKSMEIPGKVRNSTSAGPKTPEPMVTKFGVGDDFGNPYPCVKFHKNQVRGFQGHLT